MNNTIQMTHSFPQNEACPWCERQAEIDCIENGQPIYRCEICNETFIGKEGK
jgi:ribosomal protein L37AE/L43A